MTSVFQTDFIDSTVADLPQVDDVFASGAFGYRCNTAHFHPDMIFKLYHCVNIAFAFNMFSMHVRLVSGYLEDGFTVFVYRE